MLMYLTAGPKIIVLVCICSADKHRRAKLVTVTTAGTVSPLALCRFRHFQLGYSASAVICHTELVCVGTQPEASRL